MQRQLLHQYLLAENRARHFFVMVMVNHSPSARSVGKFRLESEASFSGEVCGYVGWSDRPIQSRIFGFPLTVFVRSRFNAIADDKAQRIRAE
jgi:hypothetical protein